MKKILSFIKKTFWQVETLMILPAIFFLISAYQNITTAPATARTIWTILWDICFAALFILYFVYASDRVKRLYWTCVLYTAVVILLVGSGVINYFTYGVGLISLFDILFLVLSILFLYVDLKDYKKEKFRASRCKGRIFESHCDKPILCSECSTYIHHVTPEEIAAREKKLQLERAKFCRKLEKRHKRNAFFKKILRK